MIDKYTLIALIAMFLFTIGAYVFAIQVRRKWVLIDDRLTAFMKKLQETKAQPEYKASQNLAIETGSVEDKECPNCYSKLVKNVKVEVFEKEGVTNVKQRLRCSNCKQEFTICMTI